MKFIRIILFPLVPFYYLVTFLRNMFYDIGWLKSTSYDLPVICVGNLSTGGTGKSPMIEYLIRLFKETQSVATLSRGYKRETEGFVLATSKENSDSLGDEPYQFYSKFPEVQVAVDADRRNGINQLLKQSNRPDVILLDDAYQHRRVKAGFNVLLTSYRNPYYKDIVLPTGNLREPRSGAKRADVIVVTKCPALLEEAEKKKIVRHLNPKPNQEVFFSHIIYPKKVCSYDNEIDIIKLPKFTLVTGIANPKPLVNFLIGQGLVFDHLEYPDHHKFRPNEIEMIAQKNLIVTTEKDYVRLESEAQLNDKLYYLPITIKLDRPDDFERALRMFLTEKA